ncbi:MAG: ABC transporter substrate-binding protein [bacterium]
MKRNVFVVFSLLVCLCFTALFTGCQKNAADDTVKLGAVLELTGGTATFGQSNSKGIALALEEINANGGVLGKKLVIIEEDDKSEPAEAANATKKLVDQDKVTAIIACVASSNALAAAPIAQAAGVPLVSPAATNPKVTATGDYIFRVCFIDPFQGVVGAKFATEDLKAKKAAIFTDITSDYSKGLAQCFKESFIAAGGKIVAEESYAQKDTDFNAQLTKIKSANPDIIYIPGYYTEVGMIAKQAHQQGFEIPLLGGDGWDSPKLAEIAGNAINGSYLTNHYSSEDKDARIQDFVKKYKAKYNESPDTFAALGYDAAIVIADAIKRAGSTDTQKVRDALAATKDFPAVTANITIDKNRDATKAAVILEMQNGKQHFVKKVNP